MDADVVRIPSGQLPLATFGTSGRDLSETYERYATERDGSLLK